MIKLIASDVDGTLVEDGTFKLNPEYYDVIRELDRRGILFVAASGRQYSSMRRLFSPVLKNMDFISESGSAIWKKGESYVPRAIPREDVMEMAEDAEKIPGMDYMITTADRCFLKSKDSEMYDWLEKGYRYDLEICKAKDLPENLAFTKFALYYPYKVEELTREYRKKWEKKLHLCLAGHMWLDCLMPGVNKGSALKLIQEDLKILPSETVAFGDNQNDLEMLDCADLSYAVATARDEVKERAAGGVIPSFAEDGVLQQLKKILESE